MIKELLKEDLNISKAREKEGTFMLMKGCMIPATFSQKDRF